MGAVIQVDTREKAHAIEKILATFDKEGVRYFSSKLYVGDYQRLDNGLLVVDRKQNLQEIIGNECQQHDRFKAELLRAKEAGIQIVILIEHGPNIRCIEDVENWTNPRLKLSPKAMTGKRLASVMRVQAERYGVRWEFCTKAQTGKRILKILEVDNGVH